jgi:methionyl aminopeptidase
MTDRDQIRISAMREGGKHLGRIKQQLAEFAQVGVSFEQIEAEAQRLIAVVGAKPSFSTVRGYSWATCIMKNAELCHGIPKGKYVDDGDVITIDVGLIWNGFHLDTTTTFVAGSTSPEKDHFLEIGKRALAKAIKKVAPGNSVYDISFAMQKTVEEQGFNAVYQLTGHGVGEVLHGEPEIPCVAQKKDKRVKLAAGQTIAVEIMYAAGDAYVVLDKDGWTYRTEDGSLSGMFEETVLVTENGHEVLTQVE